MNTTVLKGKWRQTKGAVQERWGDLTDDDILMLLGEKEKLIGRVQERYGYTQEQARHEVTNFLNSLRDERSALEATVESAVESAVSDIQDIQEKSMETVQEHPWLSSLFFSAAALLIGGSIFNRFFNTNKTQNRVGAKQAAG